MNRSHPHHIEGSLKRYLEIETLLNAFFASFDYCLSRCIAPELRRNGNQPVAACCTKKYYSAHDLAHPAFDLLKQERERRFGRPEDFSWGNPVSPCEYHNPERGCLLSTHKSPVCLSFICPQGIDFLRSRYGIYGYDFSGVYYALEWILTGDLPENGYLDFTAGILEMTDKVNRIKIPSDENRIATGERPVRAPARPTRNRKKKCSANICGAFRP